GARRERRQGRADQHPDLLLRQRDLGWRDADRAAGCRSPGRPLVRQCHDHRLSRRRDPRPDRATEEIDPGECSMARFVVALLCGLLVLAASLDVAAQGASAGGPYLFDLLKRPQFRASFDALFKGEQNVDAWVTEFQRSGNGVADESKRYQIEGRTY